MVYKDNPLFALIPKMEQFGGRNLPIVNVWGNPQGRSANFQRAQVRGAATTSKLDDFLLTRVKDYSIATIDNETLEASKGDANAFMEAATVEIDGAIHALTRSLSIALYKSGYGEVGQIKAGSSVAGTTLTIQNASEITNFEVGMELTVSATLTGSEKALGTSGNGLIITAVDRSAGILTFAANVNDAANGIPTIAASDYIFVRGDHSGSTRLKVSGLEAWCPTTSPLSGENFFGVDRSVDTRLYGQRLDATGAPIEEALIAGASKVAREGGALSHYFMNFEKYNELVTALGSKVQFADFKVNADIGFRGVMINGPRGAIRVVPDQNCPANKVHGITMEYMKLYSLGKAIRVIDTDGLQMLRQASADGVEVRYGFYGNVGSRAPGYNINITV